MDEERKSTPRKRDAAPYRGAPQRNSRTGVNGVSYTFTRGNAGKRRMPVFNVYYKLDGREHNKRFYLHLYSSRQACLDAAIKFRRKMEREMDRERKKRSSR